MADHLDVMEKCCSERSRASHGRTAKDHTIAVRSADMGCDVVGWIWDDKRWDKTRWEEMEEM